MSNFVWNPRVMDDAIKLAGAGLEAATIFLEGAIKETLSVPAPRVTLTDKTGARYYVAGFKISDPKRFTSPYSGGKETYATSYKFPKAGQQGAPNPFQVKYQTAPAIKGDPPRKLSGKLRMSITHEMLDHIRLFERGTAPTKGRVGVYGRPGDKKPGQAYVGDYAKRLESGPGDHGFMNRTANKYRFQIERIINNTI